MTMPQCIAPASAMAGGQRIPTVRRRPPCVY